VYSYLVANADYNANCREMALLTINSFQRDLSDANQLIRSMALRVLTSIRVREIVQIQLMSLKKCASDNSPYVRKTAAHACGKIFQIDADAKGELCETIERLLGDKNTQVLSSAVAAFAEVAPDALDLLHPHFRKLCALLADLDDWGQITALGVLTRYARANFTKPKPAAPDAPPAAAAADKKKKDFYEEDEDEEGEDEDGAPARRARAAPRPAVPRSAGRPAACARLPSAAAPPLTPARPPPPTPRAQTRTRTRRRRRSPRRRWTPTRCPRTTRCCCASRCRCCARATRASCWPSRRCTTTWGRATWRCWRAWGARSCARCARTARCSTSC